MSHHFGAAAGCIQLAIERERVCVSVWRSERLGKRMWGTSVSLYCWSLPHFSLLSLLCPPTPIFLPPFPSCNTPLHLSIFTGGIWFHDGQLGLRGSHHDWRIVHLQPQGGGPHLPGLPRWHRVCFNGAALPLTFLKICALRVGDKGEIQSRWKG